MAKANQAVTEAAQGASRSPMIARFAQVEREAQRIHDANPSRSIQAVLSGGVLHVLDKDSTTTLEIHGGKAAVSMTQTDE